ncbi:TonB-dependent receptor [bacterium]|nr:TonB-dependent receptor [bacterium]MBU1984410.1 TonB-dependent receptor [bacterium]
MSHRKYASSLMAFIMKCIWVVSLLVAGSAVFAGTVGKIAGRITDAQSGDPVIGAAVMIVGTSLGAATDLKGDFFILNVPPGKVDIRASALGYGTQVMSGIQVISDQTANVDFAFTEEALMGEEVIVYAERKLIEMDRTFGTATVGAQDIGALPVTNLSQVIEIQAGVVDGHFRGGRRNEVLYLVDGLSVTDAYDNSQGTQVDDQIVEELQVISGTFNAEYGQAMSGVVNIVTKEGASEYGGSFSSEFGDYLSNRDDVFLNIEDVSPLAIQDYSGTLYGPVPRVEGLSLFVSGRYQDDNGWMYGQNRWKPTIQIVEEILTTGDTDPFGDNSYSPMNYNIESWGHGKLSYDVTGKIKLNYSSLFSGRTYKDYAQDWKFAPFATLRRYRTGRTNFIKLNHALTASAFYEVAAANSFSEYQHYLYEDPFDSRYVDPAWADIDPGFTLNAAGNDLSRYRRWTNTNEVLGHMTWQANKQHLFKFGFDVKLHDLFFEDINLTDTSRAELFRINDVGIDPYFEPMILDVSSPAHDRYRNHPWEFALYVQDKFEVKSLIINAGLRFDYFEPDGRVLADEKDPNVYNPLRTERAADPLSTRLGYWYKEATAKYQLSPRLGIAYPMSDRGVFHFAYGHFVQRPTFERLYANPEYEMESGVGLNTVMGNPDLKMEETTTYEFGFQQEITEDLAINTALFYRDIRNLVATDKIVETYSSGTKYSQYVNRSFGEVKGITLSFDKRYANNFSSFVDYTYQTAKGDASDPQSAYNDQRGNNPREPQRQLVPLDWDRRHTLNVSLTYATVGPSGWGTTLLGKYGSGLPYTPEEQAGVRTGFENDGRRPDFYNLDLSVYKEFSLSSKLKHKIVLMLTVLNLLDTDNEDNVYRDTGRAGYSAEERYAVEDPSFNTLEEFYNNPSHYSRPRMVKVGVKYEF